MSLPFKGRLQYLFHHPEFRRRPLVVSCRLLGWDILQAVRLRSHHSCSRKFPHAHLPGKARHGRAGLFYLFRGGFESLIPFCVHHFVQPGDSCFDIGANVGMWSLLMSERCGNGGRVYSFEPLGRNARCLRQNIELSLKDNIAVVGNCFRQGNRQSPDFHAR